MWRIDIILEPNLFQANPLISWGDLGEKENERREAESRRSRKKKRSQRRNDEEEDEKKTRRRAKREIGKERGTLRLRSSLCPAPLPMWMR